MVSVPDQFLTDSTGQGNPAIPASALYGLGVPLTINDLSQMMADETEYHQPPLYQDERTGDLKHSVLANSRAQKLLDWRPETSLRDGIHRTLDWVRTGE